MCGQCSWKYRPDGGSIRMKALHVKPREFDHRITNVSNLEVSTQAIYNATMHTATHVC